MKRRDFLKDVMLASGLIGMGQLPEFPDIASRSQEAIPAPKKEEYRIDSYCHFSFMSVIDYLEQNGGPTPHPFRSLFNNTSTLINVTDRLALKDEMGIDLSVLVPLPWIETAPPVWANPELAAGCARLFNDELANMIATSPAPDRFLGVALLPTTNADVMLAELERAVGELGMVGGFYVVGPTVKTPDHPDYEQLYRRAEEMDVPLWVHPSRPAIYPDYVGEPISQYQVWQTLSWLLDSSTAMVRLVFSGVFDRYPNLKLIIHHHGALIPLFAERMQYGWDYFEQNTGQKQPTSIEPPYIEHFKKFYCDTATQGYAPYLLKIAADFFGVDRVLFGSDATMDAANGRYFTGDAIRSVEDLTRLKKDDEAIKKDDLAKIFSGNFLRLINRG
jgi:predicted TIM-barrel fold metal-dependent hydrolase